MSELETMLKASVEMIELRKEIAALRQTIANKDRRIAVLEAQLRRAAPRWPINDLNVR